MLLFNNYAGNDAGRLVPDLYLFFKQLYMRQKQVVCCLVLIYFDSPQMPYIKSKLYKYLDH